MPSHTEAFEALGLSADASRAQVRRAYRRLAKQAHPDQGGSKLGFQALQDAYEIALAHCDRRARAAARVRKSPPPAGEPGAASERPSSPEYNDATDANDNRAGMVAVALCALVALISSGPSAGGAAPVFKGVVVGFLITIVVIAVPLAVLKLLAARRSRTSE